MTYDLNKQKVEDVSTVVVPPGPIILTATSSVGLKAECGICHKEFNATNAPFHVISKIQTTKISINPTHSEYNAFSEATERIKYYRHYLAWLGYP